MTITDVITAVSVAIAAISFMAGVSAWRREFIGKRRIELAETVLALFYEAEDAIREIRNPFSFNSEGNSRKRVETETEEESKLLDRAYIVFERYQKREKLFADLRSMKYRVMAVFGADAGTPIDELSKIISEIFTAAQMLGRIYWPRQGHISRNDEQFQRHLDAMHEQEEIFWFMGGEDKVSKKVHRAVEQMESIAKEANASQTSLIEKIRNRFRKNKGST